MLEELQSHLSTFDSSDLLAKVGALHLDPRNASRTASLEALAHLVSASPGVPNAPFISRSRFRSLLNEHLSAESPAGVFDDPASEMFTDEIVFAGGSYIVFPGSSLNEQNLVRWLLKAVVLPISPTWSRSFRDEVTRAAVLCLSVSDRIARKAGIERGELPQRDRPENILVPDSTILNRGSAAVSFSRSELASITYGERVLTETIEDLSVDIGILDWSAYSFEFGQLLHSPFVVATGDRFIVPVPSCLLTGLRHRILCIAQNHGVLDDLVESFHSLVLTEIYEWLGFFDAKPEPIDFPDPAPTTFSEGLFSLDSDKAMYVQFASDSLDDFVSAFEPSRWDTEGLVEELDHRSAEVVSHLRSLNSAPEKVLVVTVIQSLGRWFMSGISDPPTDSRRLVMSASDLREMALLEAGDSLWLWKFAQAHHRIRETVDLVSTSVLDEFAIYHLNEHSYYLSDSRPPNLISIIPGEGFEIRKRVFEQLDPHGVPSFNTGYLVEVWSMFGGRVPIFSPPSQLGARPALVVEGGLPVPVWVIAAESTMRGLRELLGLLVDTLAYWLWQFESFLAPGMAELSRDRSTFVFELDFDNPQEMLEALNDPNSRQINSSPLITSTEITKSGLILKLNSSLLTRLGGSDNQGERELVAEFIRAFREAFQSDYPKLVTTLAGPKIDESIEVLAPLGQKKKMILFRLDSQRELDPKNLPKFRPVQEADFAELLDQVGEHIQSKGWKTGDIAEVNSNSVLNDAVECLYEKLQTLVATFNGDELISALIAFQESNTREMFFRRLTIPTRLACFGHRDELVSNLSKEIPEVDVANLICRFLIEYVAARLPNGSRRMSLEALDGLMALASEIINWGTMSDFSHFGLAEVSLSVLPSGRLGFDRESFMAAQKQFMSRHFGGFISESQRSFANHFNIFEGASTGNTQTPQVVVDLDSAFEGEFGLSLTEMIWLMSDIYVLGSEQEGPTKRMAASEMIKNLSSSLDWEESKIESGIDLLALDFRDDFLRPPCEGSEEVYPWRFNRSWSYLRRPLVRTNRESELLILWGNRHIIQAMNYLRQLCLSGRIKTKSVELKRVTGTWREQEAKAFEQSVAAIISDLTGVQAKLRFRKLGKLKLFEDGKNLGDIDVLAVVPSARVVLIVECKDLALARTPAEIQNQLKALVESSSGKPSTVDQHSARAKWVKNNLEEVLLQCFGIKKKGNWRVKPVLVSDSELYAPYISSIPFPAWSVASLQRMTIKELASTE